MEWEGVLTWEPQMISSGQQDLRARAYEDRVAGQEVVDGQTDSHRPGMSFLKTEYLMSLPLRSVVS